MISLKKIMFVTFFISTFFCGSAQDKRAELTEQLLKQAGNFEHLEKAKDIIEKQPDIFKYVPSIHPIAPKNNPEISSCFGWRDHPIDKKYKFHSGIDLVSEFATTIHATADGEVIFVEVKGGYGKCIIIKHKYGFETIYAHLTEYRVKKNTFVRKGEIIAFLGNTGKSTGAHLHYEIRKNSISVDPTNFISWKKTAHWVSD